MALLDVGAALRLARDAHPASVPSIISTIAAQFGAIETVLYLVDLSQTTLEPLPTGSPGTKLKSEPVLSTMAGRALVNNRAVTADRPDGVRVWVPILQGAAKTGVLGLTIPDASEGLIASCTELGLLAGFLIGALTQVTDLYEVQRRRRSPSLAASMQWDLLPPLVMTAPGVSLAGFIEPAYDVGGDCFDYAINGGTCDLAIFDAVGHNLSSALLAALVVGAYRNQRREGESLGTIHAGLDAAIVDQYADLSFATGQLAKLDLLTGTLQWTNAGHPEPMLVRNGIVVDQLHCQPTVPWGLARSTSSPSDRQTSVVPIATEKLEPGDSVLFFSDGVTEARQAGGEPFGAERLADLASRHASEGLEPDQIVRQLSRSVLDYHGESLTDDSTFLLVRWEGPR